MSDFITNMTSLFTFLVSQLSSIANFFTTNTLGIIILSLSIFSIVVNVLLRFINK